MKKNIAVVRGDGIGTEIVEEALKILKALAKLYKHDFSFSEVLAGGCAIDKTGLCLPDESLKTCKDSDAVLLGAVGGPKWDKEKSTNRPEQAILKLRKELNLFANIRPAFLFDILKEASPLKPEILEKGIDLLILRELTGGVYFGEHKTQSIDNELVASDDMSYKQSEIERIAKLGFEIARTRKKRLCSVDKANVLDTSRLWRKVLDEMAKKYPDVELEHMYVDNAAMQLCARPSHFDVLLTENMFGDILSDEASVITGSIGLIPSASINESSKGLYEPIHGSAPDIAGQNKANPIATILSVAMMLKLSFKLEKEAKAIEDAVQETLKQGFRTADIMSKDCTLLTCSQMGDEIIKNLS
ncbi:3-isopropylmalate dehydrogenase [Campylobacter avium LMG 24591]|uniref:3-isopropylmalate dehydrogenase n=1 Tax=Campylobacter avium LMG 24591 TaxID=522484 RepID=A0A222N0A7_9BACT|nr:3-isopropylmalate dehydrogenase [Campylobacter avium]ASQ31320.1 3-isopropylmalate dehydrogenase [Campylobacter avium LMG 24591]OYD79994.1 3-isopropylmalate dehydrogenase [Campylobacter avium]